MQKQTDHGLNRGLFYSNLQISIQMRTILAFVFVFTFQISIGQQRSCGCFYAKPDIEAKYGKQKSDLYNFVVDNLVQTIAETDSLYLGSLLINFKIDAGGNIVGVEFPKVKLSGGCKAKLNDKCLTMGKWIPAQNKGINVCSQYDFKISCINWQ